MRNQPVPAAGSYVAPPSYRGAQQQASYVAPPRAGGDGLLGSVRSMPKAPGPTLQQVAGLGGSSWQRGRPGMPPPQYQAPAQGGPSALVPPKLGFDWSGASNLDTTPVKASSPNPLASALGMDWLSGLKGDDASKNVADNAIAAPSAALATLGTPRGPAMPRCRPVREGCHLRFNTGSSSRQHPAKQAQKIPNADATEESPALLGVCDGVSGCTKLGISPDLLPHEILTACRNKSKPLLARAANMRTDDGQWMVELTKDAFDSTTARGATTMLLASVHSSGNLVTGNIGDCCLLVLRVIPASGQSPAHLQAVFKTKPTRYDATKPVQVQRLPNMPEERTHNVIKGMKLETCPVQSGDYVVMGSDGLFDNLQDDDIQRLVERHCPLDRAAPTAALNEASAALVNTAIARAKPNNRQDIDAMAEEKGNPDDTTALVASIVEVPDAEEFERWFWRSRGIQQPYLDQNRACNTSVPPPTSRQATGSGARGQSRGPRGRSMEPLPLSERPLQDCTNMPAGNSDQAACNGAMDDGARRLNNGPSFKGKGAGKGKGKGKDDQGKPAAPDWWTKMAVPGMAVPPQPMQAAQTQNLATGSPGEEGIANHPRLTSTILRAHEAKMACCDSIQRYGNPNVQPQPRWQPPRQAPMRNNDVADNCVIS